MPVFKNALPRLALAAGAALVGFQQTGTSAAERTVLEKLRDIVSVKDFGAVGDGVTDDTAAIQAAAAALSNYSTLEIPSGHYLVSDDIEIAATHVAVIGFGAKIEQTGANKKTLHFTDADGISVAGLHLVGLGTEHTGASESYNGVAGIFFTGAVGCVIESCRLTNHAGGGIRWSSAEGVTVTNCSVIGIGTAGGIVALDNNGDVAIGGANATVSNDVVVSNCIIYDHCFGVAVSRSYGLLVANSVIGPIPGQHGIYCAAQSGVTVSGCVFTDIAGDAFKNQISADASDIDTVDVTVVGNTFLDIGLSGVAMAPTAGSSVGRYSGVVVSSNVGRNIGNYFTSIRRCDGADIIGNRVDGCDAHPIELQDFRGRVLNNYLQNASWSGVWLQAGGPCEVVGNTLEDVCLNTEGSGTANLRYSTMMYVKEESGSGHAVIVRDNAFRMGSSPAQLARCLRSSANVDIYLDKVHNETGLPMQIETLKAANLGYTPSADHTVTASLNPSTPLYGRGRRELYGTQSPASAAMTDTFRAGDICWNAAVSTAGNPVGWICVTDGAPGTWRSFGNVTRRSTTAERPTLTASDIGIMYLDTTLDADGKPIWWTGTAWVDATGATV